MRPRSRIALRIFAFNALLVFLPVAGFSLLGSYERGLVDSLEQALAQQARVTAAWLGSEAGSRAAPRARGAAAPRLDAELARRVLESIGDRRTARFRVVDEGGTLLADSSEASGPAAAAQGRTDGAPEDAADEGPPDEPLIYRLFSAPSRLWRRLLAPPVPVLSSADFYASAGPRLLGSEIEQALAGHYGAATRVSSGGQLSVTLYSAVPVLASGTVIGAVLVSQSTYRILRDLYSIRLDIAKVFLGSLIAAAALSLLLALTIVGPIKKLRGAATAALAAGTAAARLGSPAAGEGVAASFPESRRGDEIGDLQRSLRALALRLDERVRQTERFAADAAHEFRNPLAAIRSAAELAEAAPGAADRTRFHRAIVDDAERLRSIVDGLRRLSLAEGGRELTSRERVELRPALEAACIRAAGSRTGARVSFSVEEERPGGFLETDPAAFDVMLDNLLGNAASFARGEIRVWAGEAEGSKDGGSFRETVIAIEDDGPGVPPEHLGRIFDRFFTWRPGEGRGGHTGLGLPLARALARSQGGDIDFSNRSGGGARFVLRLPRE